MSSLWVSNKTERDSIKNEEEKIIMKVALSNLLLTINQKSKEINTLRCDVMNNCTITKDRELPFVFKPKLSDYLKYPYPYTDYPERKIKNKQQ